MLEDNIIAFLYVAISTCFVVAFWILTSLKVPNTRYTWFIGGLAVVLLAVEGHESISALGLVILNLIVGGLMGLILARMLSTETLLKVVTIFCSLVGLSIIFVCGPGLLSSLSLGVFPKGARILDIVSGSIILLWSLVTFAKLQGFVRHTTTLDAMATNNFWLLCISSITLDGFLSALHNDRFFIGATLVALSSFSIAYILQQKNK